MAIFVIYQSGEIEALEFDCNNWRSWWGDYVRPSDLAAFIRRRCEEGCEVVWVSSVTTRSKDVDALV